MSTKQDVLASVDDRPGDSERHRSECSLSEPKPESDGCGTGVL